MKYANRGVARRGPPLAKVLTPLRKFSFICLSKAAPPLTENPGFATVSVCKYHNQLELFA